MKLKEKEKRLIQKYRQYFTNTGGNDLQELLERKDVTFFNNAVVATMQVACESQLHLLQALDEAGWLKDA